VSEPPREGPLAGRVVVVVGDDGAAVGKAVVVLTDAGARAAAFVGDPLGDAAALVEMVAELFPHAEPGAAELA
jgi:hypothetical protein